MGYGSFGGFNASSFSSSIGNKGGLATGSAFKEEEEKPTKRDFLINISLFMSYLITFILNIIYSDSVNINEDYFYIKHIIMCFGTALACWVMGLLVCLIFYLIYEIVKELYCDFINLYIK